MAVTNHPNTSTAVLQLMLLRGKIDLESPVKSTAMA